MVGSHTDHDPSDLPGYPGAVSRPTLIVLASTALLGAGLTAGCTSPPDPTPVAASSSPASPAPAPSESLLSDDIDDDTAVGTLAPDFPALLVPVPPDAEVLVSSAEPLGDDRLRISLNVRTDQDTGGLLEAVRAPLLAAGFSESAPPAPEPGLAAQTTFSRAEGAELLVVGVLDRDGRRTMTLGGTVAVPAP
ncbi:MAG: hypothetical protein IR158_04575 [Cellulomonas sp.]|nr:hypothetical protein [Cellulomonas sp.]